jgi:hypothetical protein
MSHRDPDQYDPFVSDDFDQEGDTRCFLFPQELDNPLIDTVCAKFENILGLPQRRPLSKYASYHKEREFVSIVGQIIKSRVRFGETVTMTPWDISPVIDVIRVCEDIHLREKTAKVDLEIPNLLVKLLGEGMTTVLGERIDLERLVLSDTTEKFLSLRNEFVSLVNKRRELSARGDYSPVMFDSETWTLILMNDFSAFWKKADDRKSGRVFLGSSDMFLGLCSIVTGRFLCKLMSDVLSETHVYPDLERVWRWQRKCLERYGNDGYEVAKSTEGLLKSYVSRHAGGSYAYPDSYDRMIAKVAEKEFKLGTQDFESSVVFDFTTDVGAVTDVSTLVEMFGVNKCISFPLIDPARGGRSARTEAKAPDISKLSALSDCLHMYSHLILKNYLSRTGKWPPIVFDDDTTSLYKLQRDQVMNIEDGSYPLSDWDGAEIRSIYEFDYHQDFLSTIKDKAGAPTFSQMKDIYRRKKVPSEARRVLLDMLKTEDFDPVGLINDYMDGLIPEDCLHILLRAKEKEHKLAARMYCMLHPRLRAPLVIIQENVKSGPFKDLPYQSMTMDRNTLMRELLSMTADSGSGRYLFIEIDLSRWNLKFRDLWIGRLGKLMDAQFSMENCFGRAHQYFERSKITLYHQDELIPALEEDNDRLYEIDHDLAWTNHLGGFEGIDQATWTVATICMLYRAMWDEDSSFKLLGQGDNQVLALLLRLKPEETVEIVSKRVMNKIEQSCRDVNHDAKPEEFVDSTVCLTYSKVFVVGGQIQPMRYKFGCKNTGAVANEVPSYIESLGSLSSGCVALGETMIRPLDAWRYQLVLHSLCLSDMRHRPWIPAGKTNSGVIIRSKDVVLLSMIVPSVLGGFPISAWTSYVCRHEPDPLGAAIAGLRIFNHPVVRNFLNALQLGRLFRRPSDHDLLSLLIKDPFSLPFRNPSNQAGMLRRSARQTMSSITVNRHIAEILRMETEADTAKLLIAVTSIRPFMPTLMHDLFGLSVLGKADEIAGMFTMTRSIVSNTRSKGSLHAHLIDTEINGVVTILLRFADMSCNHRLPSTAARTSFGFSEDLRRRWGLGDETVAGISTFHPLDFPWSTDPTRSGVSFFLSTRVHDPLREKGPYPPYLGGKTEERRSEKKYELKRTPNLQELTRLVLAATAGEMDDNVSRIFNWAILSRSEYSLEELTGILPTTIGGVIAHRYEMMSSDGRIGPIGNPTFLTNVKISSDRVDGVSSSKIDYPIAFQQFFSYGLGFLRHAGNEFCPRPRCLNILVSADKLVPLKNEPLICPVRYEGHQVDVRHNPLLYIPVIRLDMNHSVPPQHEIELLKLPDKVGRLFVRTALVSSILEFLSDPRVVSGALDSITLYSPVAYKVIDAVTFDLIGIEDVLTSLAVSVGHHAIARAMTDMSVPVRNKASMYGLIARLAYVSVGILEPHLRRFPDSLLWARIRGLIVMTQTQDSLRRTLDILARHILTTAVVFIESGDHKLFTTYYPGFNRRLNRTTYACAVDHVAKLIYFTTLFSNREAGKDTGKRSFKRLRKELSRLREYNASPFHVARLALADMSEWAMMHSRLDELTVADWLSSLSGDRRVITYPVGPSELLRWIRSKYCPLTEIPVRSEPDTSTMFTKVVIPPPITLRYTRLSHPEPFAPLFETFDNMIEEDIRDMSYCSRIARFGTAAGMESRVMTQWAFLGKLISKTEVVLVVGTGSGGIQAVLADRQIISRGLDISSSLSENLYTMRALAPIEVQLRNMTEYATYAKETFITSGNWFFEEVTRSLFDENEYTTVVVDVEQSAKRNFMTLWEPFVRTGFRGKVYVKILASRTELDRHLSELNAMDGISNLSVRLVSGCVDCHSVQHYCVDAIVDQLKIPNTVNFRIKVSLGHQPRTWSVPTDIEYSKLSYRFNSMTGGVLACTDGKRYPTSQEIFDRLAIAIRTENRRISFPRNLAAAGLTGAAILAIVEYLLMIEEKDAINFWLDNWLGPYVEVEGIKPRGKMVIGRHSKGFLEIYRKMIPLVYSSMRKSTRRYTCKDLRAEM